jgi:hypothetical protein
LTSSTKKIVLLEILWLVCCFIVATFVMIPIFLHAQHFIFLIDNIVFIVAFLTYTRLMFFVSSSILSLHPGVKLFFVATALPFTFILINRFNNFRLFIDNYGTAPFFGHLEDAVQVSNDVYLKNEMTLFGVGAIVASIVFPIFLVISIWLYKNRGRHI